MPKWIKASEQLPTEWAKVHWRMTGNKQPITSGLAHSYLYGKSEYNYDSIEWLDESVQEGWVDVMERLPEMKDGWSGIRVLAFDGSIMKVVSLYDAKDGNIRGYNTQQECYMHHITHWRPLPTAPNN